MHDATANDGSRERPISMSNKPETIGLLAALTDEIAVTVDHLRLEPHEGMHVGHHRTRRVVALTTGLGAARAVTGLKTLVGREHVDHVLHVGFAGGLDPQLRVGETPAIDWVINDQDHMIHLTGPQPRTVVCNESRSTEHTLLTLHRLADSVELKQRLHAKHRAALVDMESFAVAMKAIELGIGLTVIRAISDPADMVLLPDALRWIKPDGSRNTMAAARSAMARPWRIGALLRLRDQAKIAADRIAERVVEALDSV